jgi:hypothetical protein
MRDEETGTYWQQITGVAIAGPLKGSQLTLLPQDELSFALWKKEQPRGIVLAPVARYAAKYEKATWETEIGKLPTVIHATKGTLPDRETILGIVLHGSAKAFPVSKLTPQTPVLLDSLGGEPIMLVLGPDGKSIRVFSRQIAGRSLEFYGSSSAQSVGAQPASPKSASVAAAQPTGTQNVGTQAAAQTAEPWRLLDGSTASEWAFDGCAVSGEMKGQCLQRVDALKDYWFDWQHYHPDSAIFQH